MKFKHFFIYLLFITFSCSNASMAARGLKFISIEAKEYNNVDAFIFYHKENVNLRIEYNRGKVNIRADSPIKFKSITPISFKSMAYALKQDDLKTISFNTKEFYKDFEIINGEKLTAIKFKTDKVFQDSKHKLNYSEKPYRKYDNKKSDIYTENRNKNTQNIIKPKIKKDQYSFDIHFVFEHETSAAAFQRGNKIWVAFDNKKNFQFDNKDGFKPPMQLDNEKFSILAFDLEPLTSAEMIKLDNKWILSFKKEETKVDKELKIQKLLDRYGIKISSNNFKNIVTFTDPNVGDKITLVTSDSDEFGISKKHYFSDFTVNPSINGVAVTWLSEEYGSKLYDDGVKIFSKNNAIFDTEISKRLRKLDLKNSALPFDFKVEGANNFVDKRSILYLRIAGIEDDQKKLNEELYNLSKFFFANQMYIESMAALQLINFNVEFLNKYPESPLLRAVSYNVMGRYEDSQRILQSYLNSTLSTDLREEALIWSKLNQFKIENKIEQLNLSDYLEFFIKQYSDDLYWKVIFSELEIASLNNNQKIAEKIFKKIRTPNNKYQKNTLNYYKGLFYYKKGNLELAKNHFNFLKNNLDDPKNYVRAEFQFVNILLDNDEIEIKEAVDRLDKLKFLWRGDDLEFNILMAKAELQEKAEYYIQSIRTYKHIQNSFPNKKENVHISKKMAKIFIQNIFNSDGIVKDLSDFEVLSIYNEFRELTPIGARGDEVVLNVAKRMINLDLLDQAEILLNHQVRFRLRGEKRIITGDHLAAIYIMNKKPEEAIKTLNRTDLDNHGYLHHIERQRIRGKALLDKQNYPEAIEVMRNEDSLEANNIKKEAYFKMGNWDKFILLAESNIIPIIEDGKKIPEEKEKEVIRLAIAYSFQSKYEELDYLVSMVKSDSKILLHSLDLVKSTTGTIDVHKLENNFNIDEVENNFNSLVSEMFSK